MVCSCAPTGARRQKNVRLSAKLPTASCCPFKPRLARLSTVAEGPPTRSVSATRPCTPSRTFSRGGRELTTREHLHPINILVATTSTWLPRRSRYNGTRRRSCDVVVKKALTKMASVCVRRAARMGRFMSSRGFLQLTHRLLQPYHWLWYRVVRCGATGALRASFNSYNLLRN